MTALEQGPDEFRRTLQSLGRRRVAFVFDRATGTLQASDSDFSAMAREIASNARDFDGHEAIFLELCTETGAIFAAFLHKTVRGQGAGGVRHWSYSSVDEIISDGLRLSHGMGRKNALAGLWWGGGKGIIARPPGARPDDPGYRRAVYEGYGRFISSLHGAYVTAEDVGTRADDMAHIFRATRFVTCIPESMGGSGNPSPHTARGVICAMEAALDFANLGPLEGKRIAMQGTGNVGGYMIEQLLDAGVARIVAADISEARCGRLRERFLDTRLEVRTVEQNDLGIFSEPCDVLAPNALGGVLGPTTIPLLKARVVCGAANNQLLDERRDDKALSARGITYVPDFVANRMGIVNCANEHAGTLRNDPAIERHFDRAWTDSVHSVTRRILERARDAGTTPTAAANDLADDLGRRPHPIFGDRARQIIDRLIEDGWHRA